MRLLEAIAAEPSFLQVVVMGLVTVFVVLICLIILIKIMGSLMGGRASAPAPAPVQAAAPAPAAAQPNKQQLVAAVSAAIAEDMGSGVEHIRIHSIRKL